MSNGQSDLRALVSLLIEKGSYNMTPEACEIQAWRMAEAIVSQFDITRKAPPQKTE